MTAFQISLELYASLFRVFHVRADLAETSPIKNTKGRLSLSLSLSPCLTPSLLSIWVVRHALVLGQAVHFLETHNIYASLSRRNLLTVWVNVL